MREKSIGVASLKFWREHFPEWTQDGITPAIQYVCIDLRGFYIAMTELLLNGSYIHAAFQ